MELKTRRHASARINALPVSLLALTLISTVLRTLALLAFFDSDVGYFRADTALLPILYVLEVSAVCLCIVFPFLIIKEFSAPKHVCALEFIGTAFCALAFALAALFLLFFRARVPAPTILVLLAVVFSVLAALHFALRLRDTDSGTLAWFGYGVILAAAMILAITYFDRYTPMNAPHKISQHVCMLAAMGAILMEQRELLDRSLPRVRIATLLASFFLCTTVGISNVVAFVFGELSSVLYLFFDLIILAFAAYFGGKCLKILFPHTATESEVDA